MLGYIWVSCAFISTMGFGLVWVAGIAMDGMGMGDGWNWVWAGFGLGWVGWQGLAGMMDGWML